MRNHTLTVLKSMNVSEPLMKKLAALLASVAVLWGSHVAARDVFKGEEAVELIVKAHEEGIILRKSHDLKMGTSLDILLDLRYYACMVTIYDQFCTDVTGYGGNYEK